jgi:hypothetical protein
MLPRKNGVKRMSETEFIDKYKPEEDGGCVYRMRDWSFSKDLKAIKKAKKERRLWTMVDDGDGNLALCQGFHYVNRQYYVICAVPHGRDEQIEIVMD